MPRSIALDELATLLGVLAHRDRIRLVEELRAGECDVAHLAEALEVSASRVSQHLALLRSHRVVSKRKGGRHAYYSLVDHRLAGWLIDGLDFLEAEVAESERLRAAVIEARSRYSD